MPVALRKQKLSSKKRKLNNKVLLLIKIRFRGTKEVKKSPKYEMSYEDEIASLVIHKTEPDDAGTYSVQAANPMGQVKSEGSLNVHSKFFAILYDIFFIMSRRKVWFLSETMILTILCVFSW